MTVQNRLIVGTYDVVVPVGTHSGKKIVLASDHQGFVHKQRLFSRLKEIGHDVEDVGTYSPNRCNYPEYSFRMGQLVDADHDFNTVGVGICGSGMGIIMPAAKFMRVVAARCLTPEDAVLSRKHNNTNVIGIAAGCTTPGQAIGIVLAWLAAPFYSEGDDPVYLERYVEMMRLARDRV